MGGAGPWGAWAQVGWCHLCFSSSFILLLRGNVEMGPGSWDYSLGPLASMSPEPVPAATDHRHVPCTPHRPASLGRPMHAEVSELETTRRCGSAPFPRLVRAPREGERWGNLDSPSARGGVPSGGGAVTLWLCHCLPCTPGTCLCQAPSPSPPPPWGPASSVASSLGVLDTHGSPAGQSSGEGGVVRVGPTSWPQAPHPALRQPAVGCGCWRTRWREGCVRIGGLPLGDTRALATLPPQAEGDTGGPCPGVRVGEPVPPLDGLSPLPHWPIVYSTWKIPVL